MTRQIEGNANEEMGWKEAEKYQTNIQETIKRFAPERDKNAKPAWCYMTKKKYYRIAKEPSKIGKPIFSL